jgi:hypothetical protein
MTTFWEALAEQAEMGWTPEQARASFSRAMSRQLGDATRSSAVILRPRPARVAKPAPKYLQALRADPATRRPQ